jgi:hypothetical protein
MVPEALYNAVLNIISFDELKVIFYDYTLANRAIRLLCAARLDNQYREFFTVRPAELT